eukprot:TRINITY_DN2683_c0_g2_i2.p3 TRINITY_DN2683_c0_g2~~TRINITY_DN2683_c0_g2_i2.p3  ORF type:complete len:142 (-),score=64.58 TRINITY_DN2683_c0_g2_i2:52-477(-)
MGVPVLSGAVTTFTATFFLLFSEIELFRKFGLIVVANTAMAALWAFCFFSAYLATVGPSGDYGSCGKIVGVLCGMCSGPRGGVVRDVAVEEDEESELGRVESVRRDGSNLDDDSGDGDDQQEEEEEIEASESELSFGDMRN